MAYDYDMIVIGAGAAGLTASGVAASFGAKTLLVEKAKFGGDCTWYGCVPSKALLQSAKIAHAIRNAGLYGLTNQPVELDFKKVMERLRHIRQEIYEDADKPENLETFGVETRVGQARFLDEHTIEIAHDGQAERLSSRYFIIAAGGSPFVPPVEGLDDVPYLTNHTLFDLDERPKHLAILGGGPIGTEMAQAFRRLGSEVTVIDRGHRILRKDDDELATMLLGLLQQEGVLYAFDAEIQRASASNGQVALDLRLNGDAKTIQADALLVAAGRRPNLEGLGLDAAGLDYTERGITVDDRCRTNHGHIYAVGDVTGRYQFTHMSEHMAKVAATNAVLKVPMMIDTKHVPWVTYTEPELAHVGATERTLQEMRTSYDVYRFPYTKVDRAVTESETEGLIKIFAKSLTGKILGASVLGAHAGELICEYAVAMRNGVTLRKIADTIHPYPTYGLGARRAADQWYARKQSATFTKVLQTVLGYRGPVIAPDPDRIV